VTRLRDAAAWLDEEYRRECVVPFGGDTEAEHQRIGRRATLAEVAALLRQWDATKTEPAHRPVRLEWEEAFMRVVNGERSAAGASGES
jgi:hypothetical protein